MTYHKWLDSDWWKNIIEYYFWRILSEIMTLIFKFICWLAGTDFETERRKAWEEK